MAKEGDVIDPANPEVLAPGVTGYSIDADDATYYPVVNAVEEGNGDVGRFLDCLVASATKTIKFPTVVNDRLVGMLKRRGFQFMWEHTDMGEAVDVWVYQP